LTAFVLLCFIGGKMVVDSFKNKGCLDRECTHEPCTDRICPKRRAASLKPAHLLPLAFATSVDALAVGVSFRLIHVSIFSAVLIIGAVTFVLSMLGVKIGSVFGDRFKSKTELIGGLVLILIGLRILLVV
jgi:putative Mn2+ efflux pump MntP